MKLPIRSLASILGLIGAGVGFAVSLLYSLLHVVGRIAGITADSSHFFVGLGLSILAVVGSLVAVASGVVGAVLMLLAAIGFIFIVGWWAILPGIFLVPAAILAFSNRALFNRGSSTQQPATH